MCLKGDDEIVYVSKSISSKFTKHGCFEAKELGQLSRNPTANHADDVTRFVLVNANEEIELHLKSDDSKVRKDLMERTVTSELLTPKD